MAEIKTKPLLERRDYTMDNEQVINTIQALLEDENQLSPQVAARLTLALAAQLYVKVEELSKKFDNSDTKRASDIAVLQSEITALKEISTSLKKEVDILKNLNIILWVQMHPKVALTIATVMFLVAVFAVELKGYIFALLGFKFTP